MKILHLLSSNKLSGAENVAVEIINVFNGAIDMAYASPFGTIEKSLYERNVKYIPLKDFSLTEIKSAIKNYKPDIIHAHDIRSSVQAARVSKHIPIVSHIHGNHDSMKKISLKSVLYLLSTIKFKHIVVVSKSVIRDYIFSNMIKTKCSIIYNVINSDRVKENVIMDPIEYDYDFVYLGRLSEPKNPIRIAKIASCVLLQNKNSKFGIIGDGDMINEMKKVFIDNRVIERVKFFGFISNPHKILSQSKVMIMCSRYEGTPMAAIEALSLGIPIVSTSTDGLVELIENGVNGFISDVDDDFINKVVSIIKNKDLFKNLSIGAKKKSLSYTNIHDYKNKLVQVYSLCINEVIKS